MNPEQAFNLLSEALEAAQAGRRFTITDCANIRMAQDILSVALNLTQPVPVPVEDLAPLSQSGDEILANTKTVGEA